MSEILFDSMRICCQFLSSQMKVFWLYTNEVCLKHICLVLVPLKREGMEWKIILGKICIDALGEEDQVTIEAVMGK
jgi:hypothetical protein